MIESELLKKKAAGGEPAAFQYRETFNYPSHQQFFSLAHLLNLCRENYKFDQLQVE